MTSKQEYTLSTIPEWLHDSPFFKNLLNNAREHLADQGETDLADLTDLTDLVDEEIIKRRQDCICPQQTARSRINGS